MGYSVWGQKESDMIEYIKDGAALQDDHQVCAQDGVHAVLGEAGGVVRVVWAGLGPLRHPSCILEEEACGQNVLSPW